MSECRLILGDALEVLPTLAAGSVDAIICDPPYAIPTIVAACRSTTRNVGDLSLIEASFRLVFAEYNRVLKDTGRFFMFCDGTSYPVVFRAAYGRFAQALLVWNKGRIGMGREFRKSHELIMHCWKADTPIYADGIGRPDVMTFKPVGDEREHDAQKPVKLIEHLLTVCGRTILDPFMGSGTVGVACAKTGQDFVGVEIDAEAFAIAEKRIEKARIGGPLFADAAPAKQSLLTEV